MVPTGLVNRVDAFVIPVGREMYVQSKPAIHGAQPTGCALMEPVYVPMVSYAFRYLYFSLK